MAEPKVTTCIVRTKHTEQPLPFVTIRPIGGGPTRQHPPETKTWIREVKVEVEVDMNRLTYSAAERASRNLHSTGYDGAVVATVVEGSEELKDYQYTTHPIPPGWEQVDD